MLKFSLHLFVMMCVVALQLIGLFGARFLPSNAWALNKVDHLLNPSRITPSECELCLYVLGSVDEVQQQYYADENVVGGQNVEHVSYSAVQTCKKSPQQRGCDTVLQRGEWQKETRARVLLENVLKHTTLRSARPHLIYFIQENRPLLEEYIEYRHEMHEVRKARPEWEKALLPEYVVENGKPKPAMAPRPRCPSIVGWPEPNNIFFLRPYLFPSHGKFCYALCEGTLNWHTRLQVRFWRSYAWYTVSECVVLLLSANSGTCLMLSLVLLFMAVCLFRYTLPPLPPTELVEPEAPNVRNSLRCFVEFFFPLLHFFLYGESDNGEREGGEEGNGTTPHNEGVFMSAVRRIGLRLLTGKRARKQKAYRRR